MFKKILFTIFVLTISSCEKEKDQYVSHCHDYIMTNHSIKLWNAIPGFPNSITSTTYIDTISRFDLTDSIGIINFSLMFRANVNLKLTANVFRSDVRHSPGAAFKVGLLHRVKLLDINGNLVNIPYSNVIWEGETNDWNEGRGNVIFDGNFCGGPGDEYNILETINYEGNFVIDSDLYPTAVFVENDVSTFFFNTSGPTGGASVNSPLFRGFFGGNVSYRGDLYLEMVN